MSPRAGASSFEGVAIQETRHPRESQGSLVLGSYSAVVSEDQHVLLNGRNGSTAAERQRSDALGRCKLNRMSHGALCYTFPMLAMVRRTACYASSSDLGGSVHQRSAHPPASRRRLWAPMPGTMASQASSRLYVSSADRSGSHELRGRAMVS